MTSAARTTRWAVRLALLALATALALGGPVPNALARAVPGLSPLVTLTSTLAQRRWYVGLYWLAPPAVMVVLAVLKGRWFCRWACPLGTLYAIPERLSRRKTFLKAPLNAYLLWIIVGSSLVGLPLLAFLDPLSTFSRLTPLLRGTYTLAALVPGLLVPLMLVLGAVQPMVWCARICPLGCFLELCHSLRARGPRKVISQSRRQVVAGLLVGVPAGLVGRKLLMGRSAYAQTPILPPGAGDVESFAAACTRCYACVDACPTRVIRARFSLDRAPGQWFQPEIRYFEDPRRPDDGYCPEPCNECSRVCPAGALTPLTFDQKWRRQLGVAKVIREACLAWTDAEDCSVCQEVCPYGAVELRHSDKGVAQPVVKEDLCRGCGACHNKCPAIRAGKAIVIAGVPVQKPTADKAPSPPVA